MCPLRLILLFLSATIAGFFLLKNLKSDPSSDFDDDSNEAGDSLQESSPPPPPPSVSRSEKVKSAIGSVFWTCVDMASGRYLWTTLVSSFNHSG